MAYSPDGEFLTYASDDKKGTTVATATVGAFVGRMSSSMFASASTRGRFFSSLTVRQSLQRSSAMPSVLKLPHAHLRLARAVAASRASVVMLAMA